jgi:hypothetical protein
MPGFSLCDRVRRLPTPIEKEPGDPVSVVRTPRGTMTGIGKEEIVQTHHDLSGAMPLARARLMSSVKGRALGRMTAFPNAVMR